MKKTIALLLVLVLLLTAAFAGCKKNEEEDVSVTESSGLQDADTEIVFDDVEVTDANGEILLYDFDPGTYLVQEVATQDSYVVNSTPQEIVLEAGNTFTYNLVFLNYLKPGMTITKLDSQTYKPLANAKFRITKVGGNYSKRLRQYCAEKAKRASSPNSKK